MLKTRITTDPKKEMFSMSCLSGFSEWYSEYKFPKIIYYLPALDADWEPILKEEKHRPFFEATAKCLFFGKYLTEEALDIFFKEKHLKIDAEKITDLHFYCLVSVLRMPHFGWNIYANEEYEVSTGKPLAPDFWESFKDCSNLDFIAKMTSRLDNDHSFMPFTHVGTPYEKTPLQRIKTIKEAYEGKKFKTLKKESPSLLIKAWESVRMPGGSKPSSYFVPENIV